MHHKAAAPDVKSIPIATRSSKAWTAKVMRRSFATAFGTFLMQRCVQHLLVTRVRLRWPP